MSAIIDFTRTDLFNVATGRRKLGVPGLVDPTAIVQFQSLDLTQPLAAKNGGTGVNGCAQGEVLVSAGKDFWIRLPATTKGFALLSLGPGQTPAWRLPYPESFYDYIVTCDGKVVTDDGEPVWQL